MNINTLPQNQIIQVISPPEENLDSNNRNDTDKLKSVIYKGPKSQIGRRIAYSEICDIQLQNFEFCLPTLFSILFGFISDYPYTSMCELLAKFGPGLAIYFSLFALLLVVALSVIIPGAPAPVSLLTAYTGVPGG